MLLLNPSVCKIQLSSRLKWHSHSVFCTWALPEHCGSDWVGGRGGSGDREKTSPLAILCSSNQQEILLLHILALYRRILFQALCPSFIFLSQDMLTFWIQHDHLLPVSGKRILQHSMGEIHLVINDFIIFDIDTSAVPVFPIISNLFLPLGNTKAVYMYVYAYTLKYNHTNNYIYLHTYGKGFLCLLEVLTLLSQTSHQPDQYFSCLCIDF